MANNNLNQIIEQILHLATQTGATSAEADIGTGYGLSVTARMGEVETVEHQNDKGLSITVYINNRKGSAGTTNFNNDALSDAVTSACTIAKNANEDSCAGLLDKENLVQHVPDLDLFHPWGISPEDAIKLAIECENEARETDKRITNSEGATVNTYSGSHFYGNTHGFIGGWEWSSHSIDCTVIAQQDGHMHRDGWYSRSRDYSDLDKINLISQTAATRALARLGSRKLSTKSVSVIFEAPVATSLFSALVNAISGGSQYRKSSFLLDKKGELVFPEYLNVWEEPHLKKGMGSAPFDADGMATQKQSIIMDGVLQNYILSAYSARKLNMKPTGNAGGVHNLIIEPGNQDLQTLIKSMGKGLLITEMIGFGINQVTGDYSRGASGFWVEHGDIQYPVEEITVAGNLQEMYKNIATVGSDVDNRTNIRTGSVLVENMTVAGN